MSKLKDKVAVVSGSSRGMGRAITTRLANDGAWSAAPIGGRWSSGRGRPRDRGTGGEAFALQAGVGSIEQISRFFEAIDADTTRNDSDTRGKYETHLHHRIFRWSSARS
jgi:NAD(P)-dependent dehydrogenase (short-subunit alcohol dehydrogenase family)